MEKKRLPEFLTRENLTSNALYKVVAFVVAFAIWATMVHGRKDSIVIRSMDLELILRDNQLIGNELEKNVRVKVSGPRASLKRFMQSSPVISLDLSRESVGQKVVELTEKRLSLPASIKLLSVQPEKITVDIIER